MVFRYKHLIVIIFRRTLLFCVKGKILNEIFLKIIKTIIEGKIQTHPIVLLKIFCANLPFTLTRLEDYRTTDDFTDEQRTEWFIKTVAVLKNSG